MKYLLFASLSCILAHNNVFLKTFSKTAQKGGNVFPFIFSSDAFQLFTNNRLEDMWKIEANNVKISQWLDFIRAYSPMHQWYNSLYEVKGLTQRQGKGVVVGCVDTGVGILNPQGEYEIHPALTNALVHVPLTYNNCVDELTHMVFYSIIVPPSIYCARFRFVEERVYEALLWYGNNNSFEKWKLFLQVYGQDTLFSDKTRSTFSNKGYELFYAIQKRIQKIEWCKVEGEKVPRDTIAYSASGDVSSMHGTGIAGIIAGNTKNFQGVAPQASIILAKVFFKDARCTVGTFLEGLIMMIKHKVSLVCMSLQIPEESLSHDMRELLTSLIKLFPYSVAPSGNNFSTKKYISFPASVSTFSIGGFYYDRLGSSFPVVSYSQYQKEKGPIWLMPGATMLVPYSIEGRVIDHGYAVMNGTSYSAAFATGLLALLLAEDSQHYFTRKEILTIVFSSNLILKNRQGWDQKSILGTLDISSALFIVLVLRAVKQESHVMRSLCETYFEQCVGIMHVLLKELSYKPSRKNDAVIFFKNIICAFITQSHDSLKTILPRSLVGTCCLILHKTNYTLFENMSYEIQMLIHRHYQRPQPIIYDSIKRLYGVYEAERICEYIDSYLQYYW